MKDFLKDKLCFNHASNNVIIKLLLENPKVYRDNTEALFLHTLNAQFIWNHRIASKEHNRGVWKNIPLKTFKMKTMLVLILF